MRLRHPDHPVTARTVGSESLPWLPLFAPRHTEKYLREGALGPHQETILQTAEIGRNMTAAGLAFEYSALVTGGAAVEAVPAAAAAASAGAPVARTAALSLYLRVAAHPATMEAVTTAFEVTFDVEILPSPNDAATFAIRAEVRASKGVPGLGKKISEGHAFGKHVVKKGEFKDLGIETAEDFAKHIDDVVSRASGSNVRTLSEGRTAYWDDATGTVVIHNPSAADAGTAFRPTSGRSYFEGLE